MHKRNKKNKQKHPNPTPPQQKKDETKKDVEESKDEEMNVEIVSETVAITHNLKDEAVPEKTIIDEIAVTPAKPKRNKSGKTSKSSSKEDNNDKANDEIKNAADNKEQKIIKQELIQGVPRPDGEISKMEIVDIKDKDEKNTAPENIIPAVRKKKGKQNKGEKPTDEMMKGIIKDQSQNIVTPIPEKISAAVVAMEVEESHPSSTEYIDCSIEQKSGNKKKNKKNRKSYIEPTPVSEKMNISQIEEKSLSESVEIKQVKDKNEACPDQPSKFEYMVQPKLDTTEETVLISMDEETKAYIQNIEESTRRVETQKIQENKNEEFQKTIQKNRGKNKKKQEDFIDIKHNNKPEQTEERKDLEHESTDKDENSAKHRELKISEIGSYENTEIGTNYKLENSEQIKNAEAPISNIERVLPIADTFICDLGNDELKKDIATSKEECMESHGFINFPKKSKEVIGYGLPSFQIPMARLTLETLPPLPEDDNNNLLEDNSDPVEEIADEEFEKLLSDSPEPNLNMKEIPQAKIQTDEPDNTDPANYAPLSESNIDESCKELFEAILVEDAAVVKSTLRTISHPKKEEQFLIRLFDKSTDVKTQTESTIIRQSKHETTDLKEKVMEVNKDMEDLKLSIEKSLAELTAMESEEMIELVSISDYEPPSSLKIDKEAMMTGNVETTLTQSTQPVTSTTIIEKLFEGSESETKDAPAKKNEGTFECLKPHEICDQNIEEGTADKTEIITSNIIQENENTKGNVPNSEKSTDVVVDTTKNDTTQSQCSTPEPKGKGKGKNKKNTDKGGQTKIQSTNQTGVQSTTQTQQSSSNQECKDTTKPSETASEAKGSAQSESETPHSTEKHTKTNESDHGDNEVFTDALNLSLEGDIFFERKSAENPELESTRSLFSPIEKNMIIDHSQEPQERKAIEENEVESPMTTRSKNLLGSPNIPVTSSKIDYKKEKNKIISPNSKKARIKVKDSDEIENEKKKCSKHSQTENKLKKRSSKSASPESEDEEFVYQYSFRKVFLTNCCNICNTELKEPRYVCGYCNLIFYCSQKHKDEDWPQHQDLCFAVSTLVHLKGLKFIYGDATGCNGQDYRLLRMQVIVSCEKILKRKLLPCEQEALLYPRMCTEPKCREWKSAKLKDCEGCGLAAYCTSNPGHITREHQVWCKSYRLYHKLVTHQQCQGRLEPKLPSKVISEKGFRIPIKMNELLALVYEEKIDMDDVHYAALTQLATAPLTAVYSYQLFKETLDDLELQNGHQEKTFVLHVVGAELQFEADTLIKWEAFFLHTRPDIQTLRIVFVGPELNPSKLPLGLLTKIKICKQCRHDKRKIIFDYQDGQLYHNYVASRQFIIPDIVCAFNPGLHRKTGFGGLDSWPQTINSILKLKIPFCVTSYTKSELPQDMARIKECTENEYKSILEPTLNPFASIRPDRNFISDDEMPLIFKNYCVMVLCGV